MLCCCLEQINSCGDTRTRVGSTSLRAVAWATQHAGASRGADVIMLDSPLPELQHTEPEAPGNEQVEVTTAVPVGGAGK
jgi:hypothetical protein